MTLFDRAVIFASHPLRQYMESAGAVFKKKGGRLFCNCLVHSEKSPSCSVDEGKGLFHCFGCGAGGTVIDLVMALHGLDARGAMEKLSGGVRTPIPRKVQPQAKPEPTRVDSAYFEQLFRFWLGQTEPSQVMELSNELGVDPMALYMMGCAWSEENRAWAFPMRDGLGQIIGIRLRAKNGFKYSVTGSRAGLFYSPVPLTQKILLIVEGASDAAAAMGLGYEVIGRPSCIGQESLINHYLTANGVRRAVIVADNDSPGKNGALKLEGLLKIPCITIVLPSKDLREFVNAGGTKPVLECLIKSKIWKVKKIVG